MLVMATISGELVLDRGPFNSESLESLAARMVGPYEIPSTLFKVGDYKPMEPHVESLRQSDIGSQCCQMHLYDERS